MYVCVRPKADPDHTPYFRAWVAAPGFRVPALKPLFAFQVNLAVGRARAPTVARKVAPDSPAASEPPLTYQQFNLTSDGQ